jgi:cytochrome c556
MKLRVLFLSMIVVACFACSESGQDPTQYPNESSELAVLMRDMFEDAERMKADIAAGKTPSPQVDYERILSATATEPDKAASPEFKAFADSYISVMHSFNNANAEEAGGIFSDMVSTCTNCHESMCPGPLVRINKLK